MTVHDRREVELKLFMGYKPSDTKNIKAALKKHGFAAHEPRIESDYLPDTKGFMCRKAGILLRLRHIETRHNAYDLLTVKIRKEHREYLDFQEIETDLASPDSDTFLQINKLLKTTCNLTLSTQLTYADGLNEIVACVKKDGFTETRILLDKFRREYTRDSINITLDFFPENLGYYLEIEAYSPQDIVSIRTELNLEAKQNIVKDYGDLLKEHKKRYPDAERRRSVFTDRERRTLLK